MRTVLAIIGGLLVLGASAAAIWVAWRASTQDARIKRLQDERDDYLNRLNFIEPKVKALEQQNEMLLALHNPADQIERLGLQEKANHAETVKLVQDQNAILKMIHADLSGRNGT